jgi:hypothetical protein
MLLWLLAPDECRHGQIPRQLRSLHEVGVNLIAKVVRKDGGSSLLRQRRTELVQDLLGKSLFDHPSGVLLQNALMGHNLADAVLGELVDMMAMSNRFFFAQARCWLFMLAFCDRDNRLHVDRLR